MAFRQAPFAIQVNHQFMQFQTQLKLISYTLLRMVKGDTISLEILISTTGLLKSLES